MTNVWPDDAVRTVRRLREELEESREEARVLRAMISADKIPPWGLTQGEALVVYTIAKHGPIQSDRLAQIYESAQLLRNPTWEGDSGNNTKVFVCRARRKLPPEHAIPANSRCGRGTCAIYTIKDPSGVLAAFGERMGEAA